MIVADFRIVLILFILVSVSLFSTISKDIFEFLYKIKSFYLIKKHIMLKNIFFHVYLKKKCYKKKSVIDY